MRMPRRTPGGWRARMAEAVREGLLLWVAEDAALSDLVRQ
jgi:hypothetical protein